MNIDWMFILTFLAIKIIIGTAQVFTYFSMMLVILLSKFASSCPT